MSPSPFHDDKGLSVLWTVPHLNLVSTKWSSSATPFSPGARVTRRSPISVNRPWTTGRSAYKSNIEAYQEARSIFERTKKTGDAVLIAHAENSFNECKKEKDRLEIFKKDLGSYVRFYEYTS